MRSFPHFLGRLGRAVVFTAGTFAASPLWAVVTIGDPAVQRERPADDPGWDSVVSPSTASGVYVGNRWVLTAGHVGMPAQIVCATGAVSTVPGSEVYLCAPGTSTPTDLKLFRLAADPKLPVAKVIDTPLPVGTDIVMMGFGFQRGPAATWDINWVLGGSPTAYAGFQAILVGGRCWGTNRISGLTDFDDGLGMARVYAADFTKPGPGSTATAAEAMISMCDSGGAIFAKVGGQWRLAGTMIAYPDLPNQPWFTAAWGNETYAVELATYKSQIDAVLPLSTGYEIWQYQHFRGAAANAAADPDGDGFTNLEEYAYGLDPKVKDPRSAAPQIGLATYADGRALTATFTRNTVATDAVPTVEVSSDLVTWTSTAGATSVVSTADLGNDVQKLVVRDAMPTTGSLRRFMRIRIVR